MKSVPAKRTDAVSDSIKYGLVIQFIKTASPLYELALRTAETADLFDTHQMGKISAHFALYRKDRLSIARALALLEYVAPWKATRVYAGGKLIQDPEKFAEVLRCFVEASACQDYRAHCHVIVNHPDTEARTEAWANLAIAEMDGENRGNYGIPSEFEVEQFAMPCRMIEHETEFGGMNLSHRCTPQAQIHSIGVRKGCDWCPFFKPSDFQSLKRSIKLRV